MADLTVTAGSVKPGTGAAISSGYAGEAITAGMAVYKDATTSKWMKADNTTATKANVTGIALNTAGTDQPLAVQTSGEITAGATLTQGSVYCVGAAGGGIAPVADNGSAEYVTIIGVAKSSSVLILGIKASGVAVP